MPRPDLDPSAFRGPLTWIVAARQAPIYVRENPTERAWLTFILERETDLVLGQNISPAPSAAIAIDILREALARPMAGPPRRPSRVLVEDRDLGARLSREFDIPAQISDRPLPEADAFMEVFRNFIAMGGEDDARALDDPEDEPSYFDAGLPPPLVHRLIQAGGALGKLRPWDLFPNDTLIRMDVPDLGVKEAGLCIIGALGESRSVLLFRSRDDFLVQMGRGERLANRSEFSVERLDPGVPLLALDFESAPDVPARMKDEASTMGLKAGRRTLYPVVLCVDPDGVRRPASEHDLRLVVAAATAIDATFRRYRHRIGDPGSWPICAETPLDEGGVARLTIPFEAGVLFGQDAAPKARPKPPGRDEPCHCGSGRKYTVCHFVSDQAGWPELPRGQAQAEVAAEAMGLLLALAAIRFPDAAREIHRAAARDDADTLTASWALFHRAPKSTDATVAATLQANGIGRPEVLDWLDAQRRSWISAWYIAEASSDQFSCRDLITGEISVFVRADPRTRGRLAQGDVFLGRIVDFEHGARIFGVAPQVLSLTAAGSVAESVRRGLKTAQVTPSLLRRHRGGALVQREWNKAVKARQTR